MKIQNEMGSQGRQARSDDANDGLYYDEIANDDNNWLGVPANYSPYHPGYTTNHWLIVFRAVGAAA
jgi:hypothetical protein